MSIPDCPPQEFCKEGPRDQKIFLLPGMSLRTTATSLKQSLREFCVVCKLSSVAPSFDMGGPPNLETGNKVISYPQPKPNPNIRPLATSPDLSRTSPRHPPRVNAW